jgi:hypothetical protein
LTATRDSTVALFTLTDDGREMLTAVTATGVTP